MNNILICGNDSVFKNVLLTMLSYTKHNDSPVCVYFLTMDLHETNEKYICLTEKHRLILENVLKEKNIDSKFIVIDCTNLYTELLGTCANALNSYTPYALLRLLSDKVIKEDKILYIDTDVMVNNSLDELFNIDIEDFEYAGARDYLGRVFINPKYINSGVLYLNLKKIRETNLFSKCIVELARTKYAFPDQTVLNKFAKKKKYISDIYNFQHGYNKNCVLKHFCKTILWSKGRVVNIKQSDIERIHNVYKIYAFDDIYEKYNEILKGI